MRRILVITALAVVGSAALAAEKVVPFASLPKPVQAAIDAKYPGAKVSKAEEETESGKTSYEVALTDKGTKLDVVLDSSGAVLAVEKAIPIKTVPKAVVEGLQAKYPLAKLSKAEEITKAGKVTYELKITTSDKKKVEVTFDDAGKFVEEEAQ